MCFFMAESCVLGLIFERIRPTKLRETGKIAVCRVQHATIFHCECGQLCGGRQRTPGLSRDEQIPEHGPVLIPRREQSYIRLL